MLATTTSDDFLFSEKDYARFVCCPDSLCSTKSPGFAGFFSRPSPRPAFIFFPDFLFSRNARYMYYVDVDNTCGICILQ